MYKRQGYTTSDKKITFNIYGKETRDSNRSISFESVLVNEVKPNTILRDDAGQGLGYKNVSAGKTGYVAELYKIVKVDVYKRQVSTAGKRSLPASDGQRRRRSGSHLCKKRKDEEGASDEQECSCKRRTP